MTIRRSSPGWTLLLACGVIYVLFESAVGAALQGIFVSALYQYAGHGAVPSGFDEQTMRGAVGRK